MRTLPLGSLSRGCRCSPDHIRSVIARFPPEERAQMADEHGVVHVDCEFCAKQLPRVAARLMRACSRSRRVGLARVPNRS